MASFQELWHLFFRKLPGYSPEPVESTTLGHSNVNLAPDFVLDSEEYPSNQPSLIRWSAAAVVARGLVEPVEKCAPCLLAFEGVFTLSG